MAMTNEIYMNFVFDSKEDEKNARARMAAMEADQELQDSLKRAASLEEYYDAAVSYINVTFEAFKEKVMSIANTAYDYIQSHARLKKDELNEEELDMVTGGGIGSWFKKHWRKFAQVALGVVGAAAGIVVTAATAGTALAVGAGITTAVAGLGETIVNTI